MYIDLTHTFKDKMPVYPGDPLPELVKLDDNGIVDHQLKTSMHVGTHMDAPAHMLANGKYLSDYPAEKFFGRGILIDARGKEKIDVNLLKELPLTPSLEKRGNRIALIMTGWSQQFGDDDDYYKKYPELTQAFARKLVDLGVSIVGTDTPSPDRAPYDIHKILLAHDILIIENLTNLETLIGKTNFEIIALPAKLQTEAAPCRVVAKIGGFGKI